MLGYVVFYAKAPKIYLKNFYRKNQQYTNDTQNECNKKGF